MSKKFDLLVVGAGMGGLVLALLMARKGLRVAVLDRDAYPVPLPRGEILQPNGLKILAQLGLLQDLQKTDVHLNKQVHFQTISGAHLCTIDYARLPRPYPYALVLLPAVLHRILLDAVEEDPMIETYWRTSFHDVLWNDAQVIGVEATQSEKSVRFDCPMIVGADGAGSRVRAVFQSPYRAQAYDDGYITMVVDRPAGFQEDSRYYLGQGVIFGAFPVSSRKVYLFYLMPIQRLETAKAQGVGCLKSEMLSLHPEIEAMFRDPLQEIETWEQTAYMRCFRVACDSWVVSGGALLGDAAHAMNPHVAQGRNAAMADALALSGVLETCFNQGDFSKKTLVQYEQARRGEVDTLQAFGDEMVYFWNSPSPVLCWLRDRVFKKVQRSPHLHDKLLQTVSGVKMMPFNWIDRLSAVCP
ncbi:MAG: FAD-dependent oxidoreductase [Nitrospiria bacterium]